MSGPESPFQLTLQDLSSPAVVGSVVYWKMLYGSRRFPPETWFRFSAMSHSIRRMFEASSNRTSHFGRAQASTASQAATTLFLPDSFAA